MSGLHKSNHLVRSNAYSTAEIWSYCNITQLWKFNQTPTLLVAHKYGNILCLQPCSLLICIRPSLSLHYSPYCPLKIVRGDGVFFFDENDCRYLDCINNVALGMFNIVFVLNIIVELITTYS